MMGSPGDPTGRESASYFTNHKDLRRLLYLLKSHWNTEPGWNRCALADTGQARRELPGPIWPEFEDASVSLDRCAQRYCRFR